MPQDLHLSPLNLRRKQLRLTLLYIEGMVPAIPADTFLMPHRNKRQIQAKSFTDLVSKNVVKNYETINNRCFKVPVAITNTYMNSFFVKTIVYWNQLYDNTTSAPSKVDSSFCPSQTLSTLTSPSSIC